MFQLRTTTLGTPYGNLRMPRSVIAITYFRVEKVGCKSYFFRYLLLPCFLLPITVFPIAVCPISYYLLPITVFPIAVFPGGPLPITVFPIAVFPGGLFPITYTGCIKKNATSEFPKKSLCNS